MKIKHIHLFLLLTCIFVSGCSKIDWKGSGQRWYDDISREECMKEHRADCSDN